MSRYNQSTILIFIDCDCAPEPDISHDPFNVIFPLYSGACFDSFKLILSTSFGSTTIVVLVPRKFWRDFYRKHYRTEYY